MRRQAFNELQLQQGLPRALVIPLHGNTRWGSAWGMLARAYELRQVCLIPSAYLPLLTILAGH